MSAGVYSHINDLSRGRARSRSLSPRGVSGQWIPSSGSSKRTPVSAWGTQAPECRYSSSLPGSSTWNPWAQPSGISRALAEAGESSTACQCPLVGESLRRSTATSQTLPRRQCTSLASLLGGACKCMPRTVPRIAVWLVLICSIVRSPQTLLKIGSCLRNKFKKLPLLSFLTFPSSSLTPKTNFDVLSIGIIYRGNRFNRKIRILPFSIHYKIIPLILKVLH